MSDINDSIDPLTEDLLEFFSSYKDQSITDGDMLAAMGRICGGILSTGSATNTGLFFAAILAHRDEAESEEAEAS